MSIVDCDPFVTNDKKRFTIGLYFFVSKLFSRCTDCDGLFYLKAGASVSVFFFFGLSIFILEFYNWASYIFKNPRRATTWVGIKQRRTTILIASAMQIHLV